MSDDLPAGPVGDLPDAAREAAVEAVARILYQRHGQEMGYPIVNWRGETSEYRAAWMGDAGPIVDAVLTSSVPLIRAYIADTIEALPVTFTKDQRAMELQREMALAAARVARGGTDA